ncbi:MAG TPA: thiosulfate oxidation carrier complex protein SoxZ [Casimicrobiaceae bacterium]|nr:thiosulfate oxidation carrier complex protein SoxZ [Casimicrobiaceae bacterium]
MADSRVSVPKEARRGEPFEVRISIRHPMETGYRTDESGNHVPRNVIRRFACRYNGAPVLAVRVSSGIAANPYFRFFVTARESGALEFEWVDDAGVRGEARADVAVV